MTQEAAGADQGPPASDRFPAVLVYLALAVLGAAMGLWGAFLVPLRLPGGIEGLALVIALAGNAAVGLAAGRLLRDLTAAAMPSLGWLVAMLAVFSYRAPGDEVLIPGSLGTDPGVAHVGLLFPFAGIAGAVVAIVFAGRFIRAAPPPTKDR